MISCINCRIGRYKVVNAPYLWRIGDKTSIIPDVPALHCDVCGEMYYDQAFVYSLHLFGEHGSENGGFQGIEVRSFDLLAQSNIRRKASSDC